MHEFEISIDIISIALDGVIAAAVAALWAQVTSFVREQREANEANKLASRSMQRDVLFRYFRAVVEEQKSITPEEFSHIEQCYTAYHANGGNGAGTLMWERIRDNARIDTGRN